VNVELIGEDAEWDAFVAAHPCGLLYYTTAFRDLLVRLLNCKTRYLVARDDRGIAGLLPLVVQGGQHGDVVNSLAYYGSNGGMLTTQPEASAALAAAYTEIALDNGTVSSTVIENPLAGELQGIPHTLVDERIAHLTPLPAEGTREAVFALIDSSARRNVRKAEAAGITASRDGTQFDRLYEIHDQNIRALDGLPKDRRFFQLVPEIFERGRDYDLWVARKGGRVIAALLVFYCNGVVEYYTPAVDHEHRSEQPLAVILAEAMATAAGAGMRTWNWGGTWLTQESLRRFKVKWGAEERRYRYLTQLNDDRLLDLSPSEIMAAYPNFFVARFNALRLGGST
jgi:hypothetical protein